MMFRQGQSVEVSTAPAAWRPAKVVAIRQGRPIVTIPAYMAAPAVEGVIAPHADKIRASA